MVGDRREDMIAAHRANISAIGIAASGHTQEMLRGEGVIETFESFKNFSEELSTNSLALSRIFN
jgi:phosphoglycolate phosphatase-like HAD superfamily hydrolase